ncbi:hypothetical protein BASA61_007568 [Batrachochytrium salamandrivorans]|nr:hypothetical protein BASA61_007568 [Batrachochytrium salamandrivorans]
MSHYAKPELPNAPLLRGCINGSFAYLTIKDRLPVILTKILDQFSRLQHKEFIDKTVTIDHDRQTQLKAITFDISELKYSMVRDRPLVPISALALSDGTDINGTEWAAEVELWNSAIAEVVPESDRSWFNAPWLLVECYMYRMLRQIITDRNAWRDFDIFQEDKKASLAGSIQSVLKLSSVLGNKTVGVDHDTIQELLQSDLSLLVNAKHTDMHKMQVSRKDQLIASQGNIIVNNTDRVINKLQTIHTGEIIFVLDNAGIELFSDLCLADHLTLSTECCIVFETKQYGWFVSDATIADFHYTLNECERHGQINECHALVQAVSRWRSWLESGRWKLREDPFWMTPFSFWRIPEKAPTLLKSLVAAKFIFFKGDLNYRKMVHDASWPTTTPFSDAIGPLGKAKIAPFVMLRTCKSDTVVGIEEGQEDILNQTDANWMVNGKFGMVQYHE